MDQFLIMSFANEYVKSLSTFPPNDPADVEWTASISEAARFDRSDALDITGNLRVMGFRVAMESSNGWLAHLFQRSQKRIYAG